MKPASMLQSVTRAVAFVFELTKKYQGQFYTGLYYSTFLQKELRRRNLKIYTNKITIKNILGSQDSYLCKVRLDF
jgi:hypothetical protein